MQLFWCVYCCERKHYCWLKKTFAANDFDTGNNAEPNATATNTATDNAFGEKKVGI